MISILERVGGKDHQSVATSYIDLIKLKIEIVVVY
jgi:hypothetical protein